MLRLSGHTLSLYQLLFFRLMTCDMHGINGISVIRLIRLPEVKDGHRIAFFPVYILPRRDGDDISLFKLNVRLMRRGRFPLRIKGASDDGLISLRLIRDVFYLCFIEKGSKDEKPDGTDHNDQKCDDFCGADAFQTVESFLINGASRGI